jgi:calcium-dependent protein kinase
MRKFIEAAAFKKATLIYLAARLPEKDFSELRKLFIEIDVNGDGKIVIEEFIRSLIRFGIDSTFEEALNLVNTLDINNNGFIDYTEFLAGCMKSKIYL